MAYDVKTSVKTFAGLCYFILATWSVTFKLYFWLSMSAVPVLWSAHPSGRLHAAVLAL